MIVPEELLENNFHQCFQAWHRCWNAVFIIMTILLVSFRQHILNCTCPNLVLFFFYCFFFKFCHSTVLLFFIH